MTGGTIMQTVATTTTTTTTRNAAHRPGGQVYAALRDEFARRASGGRCASAAAAEWQRIGDATRAVLVLLAGIEGDMGTLTTREWEEVPEAEQDAIRQAARLLHADVSKLYALRGR